ncbi:hypothetical protein Vretimale_8726 [Volvox reticuliferus]|uniref:Uncharacterized protein n=1 Tax=Volvox reticuliferus TaxID=1737510 RepID=A0A8J4LN10_9CHLO|nr:hypothetical protein Vretimale_8726 [Volvox reticuliferus]
MFRVSTDLYVIVCMCVYVGGGVSNAYLATREQSRCVVPDGLMACRCADIANSNGHTTSSNKYRTAMMTQMGFDGSSYEYDVQRNAFLAAAFSMLDLYGGLVRRDSTYVRH